MKHTILILIVLCSFINAQAQKITRSYDNVSMSEALHDLNDQTHEYNISFLYNELEDFRESSYSNIVSVTVNTTIVEAPGIKTCSVKTDNNQITISWTYASGSGYSAPTKFV